MPTRRSALISPHTMLAQLALQAHVRRALLLRPGRLPPQVLSSQGWTGLRVLDGEGDPLVELTHADGTVRRFSISIKAAKGADNA
jgi:hypothetical protein